MRCCICESDSKWTNVDEFRLAPKGMSICEGCGFVSYPSLWKSPEEIKAFYRKSYRPAPNAGNYFTGERKLHFHAAFLEPLIHAWKKSGKKPVVSEIGAAYGLFLHWLKTNVKDAEIYGTELTRTYRRNAWHEFGIKLDEDFDTSRKYDLIASYKVLEHMMDADLELNKYRECLSEDGLLYISVPTWFGELSNFGEPGFQLETYYSPNHINVWTRKLFETLLKKCGFEIVRENHCYYDDTYLCKRNDSLMGKTLEVEDPKYIKQCMAKIKKASELMQEGKYPEAIAEWANFPDCWTHLFESKRAQLDKHGFDQIKSEFIDKSLAACPENSALYSLAADISMRYDKFDLAIDYLQKALIYRPESSAALIQLGHCYRQKAYREQDESNKNVLFKNARECSKHLRSVSAAHFKDSLDWQYIDNANIPAPFELE